MRKFLLAATILAPFVAAPAFAGGASQGLTAAGDINLSKTTAGSTAVVGSMQGTNAQAKAAGKAGVKGSYTDTTATQTNIGGTLAGGLALNKDAGHGGGPRADTVSVQGNGASGSAGGGQSSMSGGTAAATATNMNLGGFIKVEPPRERGHAPR